MRPLILTIWACIVLIVGCEQAELKESSHPRTSHQVLAFSAAWCGSCQRDKAMLEQLERRGVRVVRVDADSQPDLVTRYRVDRLPTYVVLQDGQEIRRTGSIFVLMKLLKILFRFLL